jgi:hypothetical protein
MLISQQLCTIFTVQITETGVLCRPMPERNGGAAVNIQL